MHYITKVLAIGGQGISKVNGMRAMNNQAALPIQP